ncbi:hypothetical protein [Pontibacter liquoris]|uniref:hypothetical protein n=1 Tax=Pontibacter liquoris TaxID=2905677 RepID=UPI001FA7C202|nr:hypothetical protein [Pontibacter liquoris]
MNEKNFEYLRDQLKYTGFGEGLEKELREKMEQKTPEFELFHQAAFGKDQAVAVLQFRKSEQDMYFFNRYLVALRGEKPADILEQTFHINKGNNITLKEAYNLMQGRAVNKDLTSREGQGYNAWLQLDFKQADPAGNYQVKQYHANYGFDLEKTLERFYIKELEDPQQKEQLIHSLKKGNQQLITALEEGYEVKRYIEASPQFKTINVYNEQRQRAMRETIQRQEPTPGESLQQQAAARQERRKEKQQQEQGEEPGPGKRTVRKSRSLKP